MAYCNILRKWYNYFDTIVSNEGVVLLTHRLQAERERIGLTVEELAALSGIAECAIRSIEREINYTITNETADVICAVLYSDVGEIFCDEELSPRARSSMSVGVIQPRLAQASETQEIICNSCNLIVRRAAYCNQCGATISN